MFIDKLSLAILIGFQITASISLLVMLFCAPRTGPFVIPLSVIIWQKRLLKISVFIAFISQYI